MVQDATTVVGLVNGTRNMSDTLKSNKTAITKIEAIKCRFVLLAVAGRIEFDDGLDVFDL